MSPSLADPTTEYEASGSSAPVTSYGIRNRELPEQLKKALISAITDAQGQEKYVRRDEVLQDARHRFYDMGIQHVYLNKGWQFSVATPGGAYSNGPNSSDYWGDYIDDYNIFAPYAQIIRAKLSEHDPGVDFQPDDPNEPADIESAKAAEAMRHDFDRNNNVKLLQQQVVYHFEMGGRAVMWTRSEDAPPRYGDTSGNPPRYVCASVYGTIEAKVPIFAETQKQFWYAIIYDDPDIKAAKSQYSWIADRLSAGAMCIQENAYERIARLGVIQNSTGRRYDWNIGDSLGHLISRGNCWLRLDAFEEMDDPLEKPDDSDVDPNTGVVLTVKQKLAQLYPDGAHVVAVGSEYAESWNESMDDCLCVGHAYIGKGQSRMPIMRPMVVVQDRFNQTLNMIAESEDYRVPSTWIGCSPVEYATINKQRSKPGAFRNLKDLPLGTKISDMVYREEDYAIPPSLMSYMEFIQQLPQFQLAVPPAVWGQAMSDQRTSSGYQLAAAQAMGILGALWDMEVSMFATMYYQNCIAISNDDKYPDQVAIPDIKGRRAVVEKSSLTKGKFRCFPDKESGFPESTSSQRQSMERLIQMIGPTPLGMQVFASPDNIAEYVRVSGMKLVVPEALARDKQLREIEILLSEPPVIGDAIIAAMVAAGEDVPVIAQAIQQARQAQAAQYQQLVQAQQIQHAGETIAAQATGAPAPPMNLPPPPDPSAVAKSSVPIWPSDYHIWEANKCQDFLTSDQCNTELTIGRPSPDPADKEEMKPNIAGVLNVFLHWSEHKAAEPMQAPPISGPLPAVGSPPKMQQLPAGS